LPNGYTRCSECLKENNKKVLASCIKKAKNKHGDLYDYSLVKFNNTDEKVDIICKKHGVFKQHIFNHIKGRGCPHCNIERLKSPVDDVIKKFKNAHGDTYDYSKMEYVNTNTKIKIICKKHGIFEQNPAKHIAGQGCPDCKLSHGEGKVKKFLKENNIKFKPQKTFDGCVNPISNIKLKFDFYLNDFNMCIEYDGEQHFEERYYTAKSGGLKRK
jgi:polyhydroxyalkanoate synthesis regulator phasin